MKSELAEAGRKQQQQEEEHETEMSEELASNGEFQRRAAIEYNACDMVCCQPF